VDNGHEGCEVNAPGGGGLGGLLLPNPIPGAGDEDGEVDHTLTVEFPLVLDRPIRFGAVLAGATGAMDVSSLGAGVDADILGLELPAGVDVDSEAFALGKYHVPEPADAAAAAFVALGVLRSRAARPRS
jgi:hypothetical protein